MFRFEQVDIPRLVALMSHRTISVATPALRVIGMRHQPHLAFALPARNAVTAVTKTQTSIRTCMLGNIVSGNDVQTQAVLAAGVLPMLVLLLEHPRQNVRREVAWAFSNITAGTFLL